MALKLVIAEKPSVGKTIAKVLGANERNYGYYEGNGYIVTWCMGHLCDLCDTGSYDRKYDIWKIEDLPIIPEKWYYEVDREKKGQFDVIKIVMNSHNFDYVVNACDAGREGERIFRNVYMMTGCKLPVKRLWISSMEDKAILDGFKNLKPGEEYEKLYHSAECRAKADWLVGINLTRLLSCIYHRTLNCGRVLSPALGFLVERNKEIEKFTPKAQYTIRLLCDGFTPSSEKIEDEETAKIKAYECTGQNAECIEFQSEEKRDNPPHLYDLTTLQRDANRILGYTAQQTLDCAQNLYEKKLCTYPRTDSKFLTDDMQKKALKLLEISANHLGYTDVPNRTYQVCDGSKVTDHFAIIPTEYSEKYDINSLPEKEKAVFLLIARRLLCSCSADFVYSSNTAFFQCGKYYFKYKYRKVISEGWKTYAKEKKIEAEDELCNINFVKGQIYPVEKVNMDISYTKPKSQFTEDTLLSAMENAGAKEMPEDSERKGLGTPATRSGIIEKLVNSGFAVREKGKLIPTDTGKSLMVVVPEKLKSALLTAEWENKLKEIEKGIINMDEFMNGISDMVTETVNNYTPVNDSKLFPSGRKVVGKCPRCGGNVSVSPKGYFCEANNCRFGIWNDNKYLVPREIPIDENTIVALLDNGRISISKIKSVKTGNYYPGILIMDDNGELTRFRIELDNSGR